MWETDKMWETVIFKKLTMAFRQWRTVWKSRVMSDLLWPHGLWNSPGQNTGMDSRSLLQECIICVLNCLALRFRRHLEPRDWQISNRMRVYVYTCLILWETLKNVKTAGKNWMWTVRKRGNLIFHPVSQSVSGCFLFFLISVFFFFNLFSYTRSYLQHVGSSSLTTDGIPASCTGNTDS